MIVEEKKKAFESRSKIITKLLRSFFAQVKTEVNIGQERKKSIFRGYGTCLQQKSIISETKIPKTSEKTTLEG